MTDKLKITRESKKHGRIYFTYNGLISQGMALEIQEKRGYHPHGYGFYSYKQEGIFEKARTSWWCSNCCD
jgi:hypothetical protein